ncbi:MAG: hypothetical protein B6D61_07275 [Bacteroidetes bacterium 4484_249]|nr:MAG: hypothetical protein B6D61_07275 [Bacteroidetes bacterium 4484_249]
MKKTIIILAAIALFSCNAETDYSPREINWDRDICINCLMGLADQKYSVQAINKYEEVIWFDDLGCLVEYEKTDAWKKWDGETAKIWIGDCETGEWIDAAKAYYRYGDRTPMGYGYGALKNNIGDSLFDYETTVARINEGKTMRKTFLEQKKMLGH